MTHTQKQESTIASDIAALLHLALIKMMPEFRDPHVTRSPKPAIYTFVFQFSPAYIWPVT